MEVDNSALRHLYESARSFFPCYPRGLLVLLPSCSDALLAIDD